MGILGLVSLVVCIFLAELKIGDLMATNFKGYALCFLNIISWVIYCFLTDRISDGYERRYC